MKVLALAALLLTHAAAQPAAPLQYGGKVYKTAKIGTQTWLAENLNYEAEGSVCYENNPDNCAKYGGFFRHLKYRKKWHFSPDDIRLCKGINSHRPRLGVRGGKSVDFAMDKRGVGEGKGGREEVGNAEEDEGLERPRL